MKKKNIILDFLYEKYYLSKSKSKQTSSFWKNLENSQIVHKNNHKFEISGYGFGDFIQESFIRNIKSIPQKIYIKNMLKKCDKNIIRDIRWIAKKTSRFLSYDLARQALILNRLKLELKNIQNKKFCIIGDGYGVLGCLIKKHFPNSQIISVNLGKILFFDVFYSEILFSDLKHSLIKNNNKFFVKDFNYIEAEKFNKVIFNADIFINVCSMGEMNLNDINNYFCRMRNQEDETYFYCCNRISKRLPDGQVINFKDYPWDKNDQIIFDEICPWHQKYPINKPPFISSFDGPIQHKLVNLKLKK